MHARRPGGRGRSRRALRARIRTRWLAVHALALVATSRQPAGLELDRRMWTREPLTRSRTLPGRGMARCAMLRCMVRALVGVALIATALAAVPIFIAVLLT